MTTELTEWNRACNAHKTQVSMHRHKKGQFVLSDFQNSCSHDSKKFQALAQKLTFRLNVAYQTLLLSKSWKANNLMALAMCLCRKSTIIKRFIY